MTGLRIGSLFTGYGGLDLGVQSVLGGRVVWTSDIDPGACKIIAHHHPDVPNLGDIAAVDWSTVEPVDVLTGGFPCQDVSHAGKRAGLNDGTRSGLWGQMARAIDELRPRLVVAENVRGLLSAKATSGVEPCPICLGDNADGALRAHGAVLGDLADIGYDARWVGLRAADVGGPHGRFRVFIAAEPAADARGEAVGFGPGLCAGEPGGLGWGRPDDVGAPTARDPHGVDPTGRPAAGQQGQARSAARPAPDADLAGSQGGESAGRRDVPHGRAAADASSDGWDEGWPESAGLVGRPDAAERSDAAWGPYEPAVRRWERILGRAAPAPTEPGAKGGQRLSPPFVEWMMGLPAGHVTDPRIGLSRNEQLKALGNGVVPQQAAAALAHLLDGEGANRMLRCSSCDGPINPQTGECRCSD